MNINDEHRRLLLQLGLRAEDLSLFDGKEVRYEFDPDKGVRIFDPHYKTSYPEYIDVDGWSAWSSEQDTFQGTILKETLPEAERRAKTDPKPSPEEIEAVMNKRFRKRKGG